MVSFDEQQPYPKIEHIHVALVSYDGCTGRSEEYAILLVPVERITYTIPVE